MRGRNKLLYPIHSNCFAYVCDWRYNGDTGGMAEYFLPRLCPVSVPKMVEVAYIPFR